MCIFDVLISNSRFPNTIVISDSNSRLPIKADVACFRSRFPIPIHDSAISRFREFASYSHFRDSAFSRFRNSAMTRFRDSMISRFRDFAFQDCAIARFRNSAISRFRDFTQYPQKRCRVNIPDVRSKRIGTAAPRLPSQHHVRSLSPHMRNAGCPLGRGRIPSSLGIVGMTWHIESRWTHRVSDSDRGAPHRTAPRVSDL